MERGNDCAVREWKFPLSSELDLDQKFGGGEVRISLTGQTRTTAGCAGDFRFNRRWRTLIGSKPRRCAGEGLADHVEQIGFCDRPWMGDLHRSDYVHGLGDVALLQSQIFQSSRQAKPHIEIVES